MQHRVPATPPPEDLPEIGVNGMAHSSAAAAGATPPTLSFDDGQSPLPEAAVRMRQQVLAFLEEQPESQRLRDVQAQVKVAMGVIDEALARYEPHELAMSYNGGKDCLVLLVLVLACLPAWAEARASKQSSTADNTAASSTPIQAQPPTPSIEPPTLPPAVAAQFPTRLQALYVVCNNAFSEVDEFVEATSQDYGLYLARCMLPMRQALEAYLEMAPGVKAMFVGTRRTDPHGEKLTHFDMTDEGWPKFMRIHPVIDWHYAEVWAFIRHLDIPYCELYDQGFTSLGGMLDTLPNPALAIDAAKTKFRPAYELMDDDEERLGRDR